MCVRIYHNHTQNTGLKWKKNHGIIRRAFAAFQNIYLKTPLKIALVK